MDCYVTIKKGWLWRLRKIWTIGCNIRFQNSEYKSEKKKHDHKSHTKIQITTGLKEEDFPFLHCPNFLQCVYIPSNGNIYINLVWKRRKSITLVNVARASLSNESKLRGWLMYPSQNWHCWDLPPLPLTSWVIRGNHLTLWASILSWKGANSSQRWLHPLWLSLHHLGCPFPITFMELFPPSAC